MLLHDLRFAARLLRKTPLFTLAVALTIALGVGATTAIFSVVNATVLRPLPFAEPDRLYWVAERNDKLHLATWTASSLNYLSWKGRTRTFEDLGAIGGTSFNLSGAEADPEQVTGIAITASVLPILGTPPLAGRSFTADEDRPGAAHVAMISEGLWHRRYGSDPSVVGRRIRLNTDDYEIVGVLPPSLAIVAPGDVAVPLAIDPAKERRLNHVVVAIGRVRAGVSAAQAQAEMDDIAAGVGREFPEVRDWGIRLVTFSHWIVGDTLRASIWVIFGAVACVLLIACANVANLLLSRAVARDREMAVRMAIGASRGRLVRQLLIESVSLAALGGLAGLALAFGTVRALNATLPQGLLPTGDVHVDAAVLAFAALVTLATGLLFGLAPAWAMARAEPHAILKQGARGSTGGRRWLRSGLAAGELALATMLLVGAGLLAQSLARLQRVDLGFAPDRLLTFQVSPPPSKYTLNEKATVFYRTLVENLRALPGVTGAAVSSAVPFGNGSYTRTPMAAAGGSILTPGTAIPVDWRVVSPDYFRTMGIPLLRGRAFTDADGPAAVTLIVVSRSTAERFFGTADPIGRTLRRVGDGKDLTVIGVVGNARQTALNQEVPAMYYASGARVLPLMDVVVRTAADPGALVPAVRQVLRGLDPDVPIATVRTMKEWLAASAAQPRLNATFVSGFSLVALLIAAVGIYGILSYSVTQRTREIGVRMALGAPRAQVLRLVVREGLLVAAAGIGAGLAGAFALGRVLSDLIYGVAAHDPATFGAVAATLLVVALAACALPARRASRVDPLEALRRE